MEWRGEDGEEGCWGVGEELGAGVEEDGAVAEAPGDGDAAGAGVAGRLDVDVGVADVDGGRGVHVELGQDGEDGVGRGLAADALAFAGDGVELSGEELGAELLDGEVGLVGDDGGEDAAPPELVEELWDAGIGCGGVGAVLGVVSAEVVVDAFLEFAGGVGGAGAFDELADAVADELSDAVLGVGWEVMGGEGSVGAGGEVSEGVEECSVEVEDGESAGKGGHGGSGEVQMEARNSRE